MHSKILFLFAIGLFFFTSTFNSAYAADGSADMSFIPANLFNTDIFALAVQPDGKILVAGDFFDPNGGINHNGIARLNADGTLDPAFGGNGASQVRALALQPDGKILIGGYFSTVNGIARERIARLNSDGTLDTGFDPGTGIAGNDRLINAIAVLPNGQILIGGDFTSINGVQRTNIARLNGNGSVDQTFNAGAVSAGTSGVVFDIVLQAGKILVCGYFDSIAGSPKGLARLTADGGVDNTFNAGGSGASHGVHAIRLQADGKIVIGGYFTSYNGTTRNKLARLTADGAVDAGFSAAIDDTSVNVYDAIILPNKKIFIVGNFGTIGGQSANRIARLNPDGSLDRSFKSATGSPVDYVYVSILQNDGRVLIGGSFTVVGGRNRQRVARLANGAAADFDGDGKTDISVFRPGDNYWYSQGSFAGFSAFPFGLPSDKLVPGDYDGDGKTDAAVYRDGNWYILGSLSGYTGVRFGLADDVPQPADFDGDGTTDIAVFRPSTGVWFILNRTTNQVRIVSFGLSSDKPVAADYDGDGRADISVYRPSEANWYRLNSSNNQFTGIHFGITTDQVVPADYDGDGKTDIAVFRDGDWYILNSSDGQFVAFHWGGSTDKAVPGDYDGDDKTDFGVFRDGPWYLQQSMDGYTAVTFGQAGDKPLPVIP